MNPEQNGYLARHLRNQFYFHYYNPASVMEYAYNFGLNPILMPHVPSSISNISINPLQNPHVIMIDPNLEEKPIAKKKRLVKKLQSINVQNGILEKQAIFEKLKKSLNYLDPCRAPPITTLRNDAQLQADFQELVKTIPLFHNSSFSIESSAQINAIKLQIIIKLPNQKDYPFLICKKRKYYRNLKRRYSVTYFQQRASFIAQKIPIPFKLEPKYKNRKSRLKELAEVNEDQFSSDQSSDSEQSLSQQFYNLNQREQQLFEQRNMIKNRQKRPEIKKQTFDSAEMERQ